MSAPRYKFSHAVVRTTTGRLVVAGGTRVDVLAPDGQSFGAITIGTGARRWSPTATAPPYGTVLIVGGYDDRIRVQPDAHIVGKLISTPRINRVRTGVPGRSA
jgi:hypothetical protein